MLNVVGRDIDLAVCEQNGEPAMVAEGNLTLPTNPRESWQHYHKPVALFIQNINTDQECPGICGKPWVAEADKHSVTLEWCKPITEGSAPIIAYKVEVAPLENPEKWIEVGLSPRCMLEVHNLKAGKHFVRVSAGNKHGFGPVRLSDCLTVDEGESVSQFLSDVQVISQGDHLLLMCQVCGCPRPIVKWMYEEDEIVPDDRRKIEESGDVYTLLIENATKLDSGLYTVEATNSEGRTTSCCYVSVTLEPSLNGTDESIYRRRKAVDRKPHFTLELRDKSVDPFSPAIIGCHISAHPAPTVTWLKDGALLEETENIILRMDGDHHGVEILKVNPSDCGLYTCTAENNIGVSNTTCCLSLSKSGQHLLEAPRFCPDLDEVVEAVKGDTVRIAARVVAGYRPAISWSKDGIEIKPRRERVITQSSDGTVELCLANIKLADRGTYTCKAIGLSGESTESTCQLVIIEEQVKLVSPSYTPIPYSDKPLFITKPQCTEALEGDTVRFWCQVVGDPKPKVVWYRNNLKVEYYREKSQFVCTSEGADHWLEIKRCCLDFSGWYIAEASNLHGSAKVVFSLQVFAPGEGHVLKIAPGEVRQAEVDSLPLVTRPLVDSRCTVGFPINLECRIKGESSSILWTKDGILLKKGEKWTEGESVGIRLDAALWSDQGLYKCEVTNQLGVASTSAYLTVENKEKEEGKSYSNSVSPCVTRHGIEAVGKLKSRRRTPAKLLTVPHDRVALVGETVRFTCAVRGYPDPTTDWYKDGKPIIGSRYRIQENEDIRSLVMEGVTREDAGKYTVVVQNGHGEVKASAHLQIVSHDFKKKPVTVKDHYQFGRKYRQQQQQLQKQKSYQTSEPSSHISGQPVQECTATEGTTFTLTCHVGTGDKVHSTSTWYKNGELLIDGGQWSILETPTESQLKLGPLRSEDSGLYSCHLAGGWGLSRGLVKLTVTPLVTTAVSEISPPLFSQGLPKELTVMEGNECTITAIVTGEGPLRAVWSRGEEEIPDCDDMAHISGPDGQFSLRISDVFLQDSGLYTCTVYNKHGMAQSHTRLVVVEECMEKSSSAEEEVPAKILSGPQDATVLMGNKATLSATFEGKPQPTLLWSKAGIELSANDRLNTLTDYEQGLTTLVIDPVCTDDSGKYVLTVYNHLATDYHFASLSVEGVPDPPAGRPTAVLVHPGVVRVAWSSPHYDGGSKITGYSVQMSLDDGQIWTNAKEMCYSLSYTLSNIPQGQTCKFRVCSHNVHGSSEPSLESTSLALRKKDDASKAICFEDGSLFGLRYSTLEELGKGRYGTVHRIKERGSGKDYAAKTVRCIKKEDREKATEELQIMNSLKHSKLLQIVAAYENARDVTLVVEYISGGELFERVVADDFTLTERDCILFMRQICEGVEYMHSQSVVHLDLKPENIMCINRDSHEIKLIDFGLAQRLKPDSQIRVLFGTPEFIAPEIINYEPIGTQTDMWSVGVICYVLLSGLSPFMGDNDAETFANITRADFDFDDEAFDSISNEAKGFISELLVKRKEKRLTAAECLSHRWLCQEDTEMSQVKLCTDKLKKFIIRRKWQKRGFVAKG
ncbi:myosin light chain kinase, smooth muscle-like isoform X3 [Rhodnius prolixus]|uniref:myosin light chain kinase, smooth muscle-like isoform X3 n=1 Tax=Rhodnius prolixus TaxID=13249 RepID=UPI003D18E424